MKDFIINEDRWRFQAHKELTLLSFTEVQTIKSEMRNRYSSAIRDFLNFSYQEHFNQEDPRLSIFVTNHFWFFSNALSKSDDDLLRQYKHLSDTASRHKISSQILSDINIGMINELFKLVAIQHRNSSSEQTSAFNMVVSLFGWSIWNVASETSTTAISPSYLPAVADNSDPAVIAMDLFRNRK
jgi:hypothetical protein